MSYVEIYNEELKDLLGGDLVTGHADGSGGVGQQQPDVKLRLFEDQGKKGSVVISGLEEGTYSLLL